MKKFLASLLLILSVFLSIPGVYAEEKERKPINVYIFTKEGCTYCAKAKAFLAELETDEEYGPMYDVVEYEVWDANWNQDAELYTLLSDVAAEFGETVSGAPYLVIGDTSFPGYQESLDEDMKEAIKTSYEDDDYVDMIEYVQGQDKDNTVVNTIVLITILVVLVGGGAALVVFSRKANK